MLFAAAAGTHLVSANFSLGDRRRVHHAVNVKPAPVFSNESTRLPLTAHSPIHAVPCFKLDHTFVICCLTRLGLDDPERQPLSWVSLQLDVRWSSGLMPGFFKIALRLD